MKSHIVNLYGEATLRFIRLIALMMEAACTSETSVDIQLITRQYIPENSELNISECSEGILHRSPIYCVSIRNCGLCVFCIRVSE
jgi:hypothetical protein